MFISYLMPWHFFHILVSIFHQFVLLLLLRFLLLLQPACVFCSVDTQRNGLVFVYDMTDSKFSNFDYDLSVKILDLLKVIESGWLGNLISRVIITSTYL